MQSKASEIRGRFQDLTDEYFAESLLGRFQVRRVNEDDWGPILAELVARTRPPRRRLHLEALYSEADRAGFEALDGLLSQDPLVHRLVFLVGEEVAGGFLGRQEPDSRYRLVQTLIRPAFTDRGLRTAFLSRLLPLLAEIGFREAITDVRANDNDALVSLLTIGFVVSGFEIAPERGLVVHLSYPFSEDLKTVHDYRVDPNLHVDYLREKGALGDGSDSVDSE